MPFAPQSMHWSFKIIRGVLTCRIVSSFLVSRLRNNECTLWVHVRFLMNCVKPIRDIAYVLTVNYLYFYLSAAVA